ncbi:hypothetical protein TKWG_08035 [Advenella kashmirensis WT001]|uniref:Uncharacterized protein n=1 Tax=Advenella kashmirensis (strain DSM 17095 / LMG 22695 / WT001) TaxID=1036672 RepID=I3UAH1_ADVKW|nr:hypothetical protein TKWG_08035 [Advenella kashmirensis WT001]
MSAGYCASKTRQQAKLNSTALATVIGAIAVLFLFPTGKVPDRIQRTARLIRILPSVTTHEVKVLCYYVINSRYVGLSVLANACASTQINGCQSNCANSNEKDRVLPDAGLGPIMI